MLYLLFFTMTLMGAFGAFFLKRTSESAELLALLKNWNFYLGGGLYALSAVVNVYILNYLPYCVVLPLTSVTYVWTALIGWKLLGEKLTRRCCIGIAVIICGVAILVSA